MLAARFIALIPKKMSQSEGDVSDRANCNLGQMPKQL